MMMMDAQAVLTIGTTVTILTQIGKRALPGDGKGPYLAGLISLAAVAIWVLSAPTFPPDRTDVWAIFAGWASVFGTSIGIYHGATMATSAADRVRSAGAANHGRSPVAPAASGPSPTASAARREPPTLVSPPGAP